MILSGSTRLWLFGALIEAPGLLLVGLVVAAIVALGYAGVRLWVWGLALAAILWVFGAPVWLWIVLGLPTLVLILPPLRRLALTGPVMRYLAGTGFLPVISDTERQALDAGTVWIEGELFSGKPDWNRILTEPYAAPTGEEQAFLDGPVAEVCAMTDDWSVFGRGDLPPEVWAFLKQKGFFGLIIPKQHGGLGFTPSGNSAVVARLAARSMALAVTVMVPNSLGPAELLIHYGTEEQQKHWLPRLASGEEIPCFALTEPEAGSDAASIGASGEVFRGEDGTPWLRLNWSKRYTTLVEVATVMGLAFKLSDPGNLLGHGTEPGITCALVPADGPGIERSLRHDPLGIPFYNGPSTGVNVEIPAEAIIGGADGAGAGWRMLMECLSAGRGISLPATSTGGARLVARVAGAHAFVRKQFGLSIGRFEGIHEPLARIGATAWLLEAARRYTCGALDGGAKPAIVTAMVKLMSTELFRASINDGMDILAGNGISLGPRNLLGPAYLGTPIGITVEGANILTRTLIVFGQGSVRCHPWVQKEIAALADGDTVAFDRAISGHVRHVVRNSFRASVLCCTRGIFARSPIVGPAAPWVRRLTWASATFAYTADLAMAALGSTLRRRERLTGRLADVLGWMFLGTAAIRRFEAEGRLPEARPFLDWCLEHACDRIQHGLLGVYRELRLPIVGRAISLAALFWLRINPIGRPPPDRLGSLVAEAIQEPGPARDAASVGIWIPSAPEEALARLERAFEICHRAREIRDRLRGAVREGRIAKAAAFADQITAAREAGILDDEEVRTLEAAEAARADVIAVDAFTPEEFAARRGGGT